MRVLYISAFLLAVVACLFFLEGQYDIVLYMKGSLCTMDEKPDSVTQNQDSNTSVTVSPNQDSDTSVTQTKDNSVTPNQETGTSKAHKKDSSNNADCSSRPPSSFRAVYLPNPMEKVDTSQWKGQVGQDRLILSSLLREPFKTGGFYVDLASYDPEYLSNTVVMDHLYGWKGICWEANPLFWYKLAARRSCNIVGGAAYSKSGVPVTFVFHQESYLSGIVGGDIKSKDEGTPTEITTTTMTEVLNMVKAPSRMDYLSLDVEGAESWAMQGFNFSRYVFDVVTIERPKDDLKDNMEKHGYIQIGVLGWFGETVWLHESNPNIERFAPSEDALESVVETLPSSPPPPVQGAHT